MPRILKRISARCDGRCADPMRGQVARDGRPRCGPPACPRAELTRDPRACTLAPLQLYSSGQPGPKHRLCVSCFKTPHLDPRASRARPSRRPLTPRASSLEPRRLEPRPRPSTLNPRPSPSILDSPGLAAAAAAAAVTSGPTGKQGLELTRLHSSHVVRQDSFAKLQAHDPFLSSRVMLMGRVLSQYM